MISGSRYLLVGAIRAPDDSSCPGGLPAAVSMFDAAVCLDHQFALLLEVGLVKFVVFKCVRWSAALASALP